jgi:predicted nuclease of predicted toxin-antitoxin system
LNGFLLDENIPGRLRFTLHRPVLHVRDLGRSRSDTLIWQHAQSNGYVIVTKDSDFSNRILLATPPPLGVHLRIGNVRLRDFYALLARAWPQVEALLPEHKLVNIYPNRIEAVR